MPEILTESFCERCGTRYTFESAAPRGARLKGIKVMSRGLRNFVMSDDTSMDEAMAAARNETDREQTAHQLDAFHKTFNFCMSCRQYTCGNCWNDVDGRCLSCAPHLGHEMMPAPFPNVGAGGAVTLTDSEAVGLQTRNGHDEASPVEPMAWPTSDLMREVEEQAAQPASFEEALAARQVEPAGSVAEPDEPEPVDLASRLAAVAGADVDEAVSPLEPLVEAAPVPVVQAEPAASEAEPDVFDDPAVAATANTSDFLQRFRPGQSLDDEIEAYERAQAAAAAEAASIVETVAPPPLAARPEPEPVVAMAPEPEPEVVEPEPMVAIDSEPEPEPVAPAPEPEPVAAAPEPEPIAPRPREDLITQPTWQIVAPEAPAEDRFAASAEPQWPAQPEWPAPQSDQGLAFLGRPASASGGMDAIWAESAKAVATTQPADGPRVAGGVQPCVSCGLSLSANARFCRRCGTRQG